MNKTTHHSFKAMMSIFLTMAFLMTSFPFSQRKVDVVVQAKDGYFSEARLIETEEIGIERPAGLIYSVKDKDFRVISKDREAGSVEPLEMAVMDEHGELKNKDMKKIPNADPINIAYSAFLDKILIIEPSGHRIAMVSTASEANVESYIEIGEGKFKSPKGIAVDPDDGTIYVIDQVGPRLVKIVPDGDGYMNVTITETLLPSLEKAKLQGIALDPTTGHLHLLGTEGEILYEMTDSGEVVGTRDLSILRLSDPQAMVFAPSYDNTDKADTMDLYIADSGVSTDEALPGLIVELSFAAPAALMEAGFTSQLINTIDTSRFSPPAPDASSVEYIPTLNRLLILDSEVNEMPIYAGATVFETQLDGTLYRTGHTLKYSPESTGITFNSANGNLFVSDDDKRRVFEVTFGLDGLFGTEDDVATYFSTLNFGSNDPEGVAFDASTGTLYIADGNNAEVYKVTTGANGRFDGVSPEGDDVVSQFDTMGLGVKDPEGIGFDPQTGNLYIVGEPVNAVAEITTDGALVRVIDILAAHSYVPSGIGVGPSSMNPAQVVMYVSERGIDNAVDPLENDGKVYELSLPYLPAENTSPILTVSGPMDNSTYSVSSSITFIGNARDVEDGDLSAAIQWNSSIDGLIGIGGSFTRNDLTVGVHTITVAVSDSQGLTGTSTLTVTVDALNSSPTVTISSPANNASAKSGDVITFQATASDQEDGDLSAAIQWSSSLDGPIGTGTTFQKSDLSIGSHSIKATVADNAGLSAEHTVALTVTAVNTAPVVTIAQPADGSVFLKGQKVIFSGTAIDAEDGDRAATLLWTSSRDGLIGRTGLAARATLSVGTHIITATATDSVGLKGSASITIVITDNVVNTAPVLTVSSPTDNSIYSGSSPITFTGNAQDAEDGDRSAAIQWTSSIDGLIGTGGSFIRNDLTAGTHNITVTVSDSQGLTGTSSMTITIEAINSSPTLLINSPANNTSAQSGDIITFQATASDQEDGDLSASIQWSSSLDGPIGTGGTFEKSNLSIGSHSIKATATDSAGLQAVDTVNITVAAVVTGPVVTIAQPSDGSVFVKGQKVTFSGTALDADDGDRTSTILWTSSIDGLIGRGGLAAKATLSVGTHIITATATNLIGLKGTASITIVVTENTAPVATITKPLDGAVFVKGKSIAFSGTATDAEDGDRTSSLRWTSSINGIIGSKGDFSRSTLSVGTHIITATATDLGGLKGSASITIVIIETAVNNAPVLTVSSPTDNSTYSVSSPITFEGNAQDVEDGDRSVAIQWNSSIDGLIGTGGSFIRNDLTAGTHTITATVSDSQELTGTSSMTITVDPLTSSPTLLISSPENNTSAISGDIITFLATAVDQEDGDLSASIQWDSSLDGPIGTGATFEKSNFSVGNHKIKATVTDKAGLKAEHSVDLTVTAVETAPVVTITQPLDGSIFVKGQKVTFSGTAIDAEDGDRTFTILWTSSLDGLIGRKGLAAKATLSVGTHIITATATDSAGVKGSVSITIVVT